jgi:hypothetical protein
MPSIFAYAIPLSRPVFREQDIVADCYFRSRKLLCISDGTVQFAFCVLTKVIQTTVKTVAP